MKSIFSWRQLFAPVGRVMTWINRGGLSQFVRSWWPVIAFVCAWFAAMLTDRYQDRQAAVAVLNQREEAESRLRSEMFRSLISPIVFGDKDGINDVHRYSLLVELLALNFHEHLEAKPLMLDAYHRLSEEMIRQDSRLTEEQKKGDEKYRRLVETRASLLSVARRVVSRQLAMLGSAPPAGCVYAQDKIPAATEVEFDLRRWKDGDMLQIAKIGQFPNDQLVDLKDMLRELLNSDDKEAETQFSFDPNSIILRRTRDSAQVKLDWVKDIAGAKDVMTLKSRMAELFNNVPENYSEDGKLWARNLKEGILVNYAHYKVGLISFDNEKQQFSPPFQIVSPDCRHRFRVYFHDFDWENGSVRAEVYDDRPGPEANQQGDQTKSQDQRNENYYGLDKRIIFTTTQFDFPFTDNSLLDDGNRFSIFIHGMKNTNTEEKEMIMKVRLRWFPKDYIPSRERPSDYQKFREDVPVLSGETNHGWLTRLIETFPRPVR